jgi:CDP-glucose 4,6-dehydratase
VSRPDRRFWSGKHVLLTGHTGFKGSWATIWLADMGARVAGLSLAPDQTPALYDLANVGDLARPSILVDLRNREALDALPADSFDIVLHMAAQPIVRASIEDPIATFATNIMGTAHLLEALRAQPKLRAILAITSDKVYANAEAGRAFTEADPLGGKDPYSASKAAAEIVIQSYARTFFDRLGIPLATARGGNVIGGGDFSRDRLIADLVRAARAGESAVLRHPGSTRPWQHVLDCVAGYLVYLERLATDPETPRALNFGPRPGGRAVSVGELATRANAALGAKPWRHEPELQSLEATTLGIDTGLAKSFLNFESRLDAHAAVDWTVEWYARQRRGENALALCREQIAFYERL